VLTMRKLGFGPLLVAILLISLFAGLGIRSSSVHASKAKALSGQSIVFLTPPWGVPPTKSALTAFEKKTGITVTVNSVPDQQLYTKVQIAAATQKAPGDVIFLSEEAPSNIMASGDLLPLDKYQSASPDLKTSDIVQNNFWRYKGKQYGINSYVQLVMADYDSAQLKKAGFSSPPTTWQQLLKEARVLKSKGIDNYPVALAAVDWDWYIMALSMGDRMFDKNTNPTFTAANSPGRKALRLLVQFFKEGLASPTLQTELSPHNVYESGIGTFHQGWEGALAVLNNPKISKHAPHVKYMLLPDKHYTWSFPAGLGISKYSSHADAAWAFIKWYLQPAQQRDIYAAYGLVPSRKSVQQQLNKSKQLAGYSMIKQQAKYVHELPRQVRWWGTFTSDVTSQIRQAVAGQTSADQAIDALGKKWSSLRSQYGSG
jgi:multiple sugar transport system substrate-binding protein